MTETIMTDNSETLKNALLKIKALEEQIEKMKCCPNCKSWDSQNLNFCEKEKRMCGYRACEEWELAEN